MANAEDVVNIRQVSLRVSLVALTLIATAVSVAAFQAGAQQNPSVSVETPAKLQLADVPRWPYPPMPLDGAPEPPTLNFDQPYHVPGSTKTYTMTETDRSNTVVDWFPEAHRKAPSPVLHIKPGVYRACGLCHMSTGNSKPDMQSLNGLPVAYMRQQLKDIKDDRRHPSFTDTDTIAMIPVAKALPENDANEALEYFHSLGPSKWYHVLESETVPKTIIGRHSILALDPSGEKEPIGNRIVEIPVDYDRVLMRDPTSGFVAYVPPGSLARGEALVRTGAGGRTVACTSCHGSDLHHGIRDIIPPIAGRSATATGRQLYDFKTGARHGKNSSMMQPAVAKLTDEDIIDISAYVASLPQ